MSAEMNLFVLTGRVARVHKGERMCKVTLVTSEMRWDKEKGEETSRPTYHNVTFFSDTMGLVTGQEINEGDTVSCTGTIRYRRIDPDGQLGEKFKWTEEATLMGMSLTVAREKGGGKRQERNDGPPSGRGSGGPGRGPSGGPPGKKPAPAPAWPYTHKGVEWGKPDGNGYSYAQMDGYTAAALWSDPKDPRKGATFYVDNNGEWQETEDPDCPF